MTQGLHKLRKIEDYRAMCLGLRPFWAFTIRVAVNVPFGYLLSTVGFSKFWSNISRMI